MHKYGIIIYWSDEDQLYIAEVPELPGCVTHGDTQSEALKNAGEAIQLWIETAKEFGNPVPRSRGKRMNIRSHAEAKYRAIRGGATGRKSNPRNFAHERSSQPTMNPLAH